MSNDNSKTELPSAQWINWFAGTVVAALAVVVFLFSTFITKESQGIFKDTVEKRLDRIEIKIDRLIQKSR